MSTTESARTTTPDTPARLMQVFADLVAAGDLDALVALYADDAVFQPTFDVQLRGDQIRAALGELLNLRPTITYEGEPTVTITGDVALVANVWSMTGTAPDGTIVCEGGVSADVVRRRPDGMWEVLIDQPRGEHR